MIYEQRLRRIRFWFPRKMFGRWCWSYTAREELVPYKEILPNACPPHDPIVMPGYVWMWTFLDWEREPQDD